MKKCCIGLTVHFTAGWAAVLPGAGAMITYVWAKEMQLLRIIVSRVWGHSFYSWFITEALPHLPIGKHIQWSHGDIQRWMREKIEHYFSCAYLTFPQAVSYLWSGKENQLHFDWVKICVLYLGFVYFHGYISSTFVNSSFFFLFLKDIIALILQLYLLPVLLQILHGPFLCLSEKYFLCCPEWFLLFLVVYHCTKSVLVTSVRLCIILPLVALCDVLCVFCRAASNLRYR